METRTGSTGSLPAPHRSAADADPGPVDWGLALATARRLSSPGPRTAAGEIADLVAELRTAAVASRDRVADATGLTTPDGAPDALVVDRAQWARANIASLRALVDPMLVRALERQRGRHAEAPTGGTPSGLPARVSSTATAVSRRVAGLEVGGLLAFVSGKVLGQYDLAPQGVPRLLLVAPNVLAVERELDVDPGDFRRWVCLHEETHRVQFTAVPWLRDHLVDSVRGLGDTLADTDDLGQRLNGLVEQLPAVLRGEVDLSTAVASPEQRAEIARLTAIMSLLEGHADVVMDAASPGFVPSVATIRERFDERRKGAGGLDKVLRRLLGLEAKMRQYSEGAGFVRGVQERVGVEGFNAVWTSPQTLPTPEEIPDPGAWVARVHG